jgi:hypothetical protein
VIVDDHVAADLASRDLPDRGGVLLLGSDLDDATVWSRRETLGATRVVFLPDDCGWLRKLIAIAARPEAFTIAVLPARGGAGASTLAVALTIEAVNLGHPAILFDADPLGGGIADLVDPDRLPAPNPAGRTLPGRDTRLLVVSWEQDDIVVMPRDTAPAAIEVARRGADVVIVDCQRYPDETMAYILARADLTLLVTPTDDHAIRCGRRVLVWVREFADHGRVEAVAHTSQPASAASALAASRLGIGLAEQITCGDPYTAARNLLTRELP